MIIVLTSFNRQFQCKEDDLTNVDSLMYKKDELTYCTMEIYQNIGKALLVSILDIFEKNPCTRLLNTQYTNLSALRKEIAGFLSRYTRFKRDANISKKYRKIEESVKEIFYDYFIRKNVFYDSKLFQMQPTQTTNQLVTQQGSNLHGNSQSQVVQSQLYNNGQSQIAQSYLYSNSQSQVIQPHPSSNGSSQFINSHLHPHSHPHSHLPPPSTLSSQTGMVAQFIKLLPTAYKKTNKHLPLEELKNIKMHNKIPAHRNLKVSPMIESFGPSDEDTDENYNLVNEDNIASVERNKPIETNTLIGGFNTSNANGNKNTNRIFMDKFEKSPTRIRKKGSGTERQKDLLLVGKAKGISNIIKDKFIKPMTNSLRIVPVPIESHSRGLSIIDSCHLEKLIFEKNGIERADRLMEKAIEKILDKEKMKIAVDEKFDLNLYTNALRTGVSTTKGSNRNLTNNKSK